MDIRNSLSRLLNLDADALAECREGIAAHISAMAALALAAFTLVHLAAGRWAPAAINGLLMGVFVTNAWFQRRHKNPVVPFWFLIVVLVCGIGASILLQGWPGVLWGFPTLFACYFALSRRVASVLSLVLLGVVTLFASWTLGGDMAARVFAAMVILLVMIHIVLNVIGDLQHALLLQTITDPLTGAFNRRHLQAQLLQWEQGARPTAGVEPGPRADALLAIDIDHFKRINDEHGHDAGDAVLCRLVEIVHARKRNSDVLFRTGGEEFVLLVSRLSASAAKAVAEDLRERLACADWPAALAITVSIGVAPSRAGKNATDWIKAADEALYEAKRSGRNRVVMLEPA